ncbi:MAG: hypothetical protein ISR87_08110 [Candidatus Marinimicrobia bacterium]|nr:hypothetical protein [FCB group bacterium]MBL7025407.1 hypothetical protein [Candidatus Neomarinimicrobiota bacterium]
MIKKSLCFMFLAVLAFGQFEVIRISEELSGQTRSSLWHVFKSGAIIINNTEVIIPDKSSLFLQGRSAPHDYTRIDLRRYKSDSFIVYKVTANNNIYAYSVLGGDGRRYIFERKKKTGEIQGPVLRHGLVAERMFLLEKNNLVATGAYRPELMGFLDRYMKGSIEEQRKNAKEKYDPLYENHKAYTISVYDNDLNEIDSGNVIDRTGDNARAFEGLFLTIAVDLAKDNVLYLIDNDQGYVVEKYTNLTKFDSSFEIKNSSFKKLPAFMTMKDLDDFRAKNRAYSVPYALYEKDGFLMTCFFQAPEYFDPIDPPYYYDISTVAGETMHSGVLDYPVLCEDDGNKVFFYVKQEGGWFEDDLHFLVGVTTDDLLKGLVSKTSIDASIENYKNIE